MSWSIRVSAIVFVAMSAAATVAMSIGATVAKSDVIAVLARKAPGRTDADVIRVNAGTGALTVAPFNTTADEFHPSASSDGNRIAFERIDSKQTASLSVFVNDLQDGQTIETLSESEAQARFASSPALSPDGQTLWTGGAWMTVQSGHFIPTVTSYNLAAFPGGPFGISSYQTPYSFPQAGQVFDPVQSGSLLAFTLASGRQEGLVVAQLGGGASPELTSSTTGYFKPALGSPGGTPTVVFEVHAAGSEFLASRPARPDASFVGPPTPLPGLDTQNATAPAFTADGRYIGYIVGKVNDSDARLFVWDTESQTSINPAGIDVGDATVGSPEETEELEAQNLTLYEHTLITGGRITPVGAVNFHLAQASDVGILVQRVVGHHVLFGRRVPTLKPVGRVPLGKFKRGGRHARWNLQVAGRRLTRGVYQVTLRALTGSRKIRDLGTPDLIRVG
jgi:hypothetical protein